MNRWMLILYIIVITAALILGLVKQCTQPQIAIRERIDTVRVLVPPVVLTTPPQRVRLVVRDTVAVLDTAMVTRLLNQRDLLQEEIRRLGATSVFSIDTVTVRGDTLSVDCNETDRTITLQLRMAPVESVRVVRDTTLVVEPASPWSLSVGIGAAATPQISPAVFIGLTYRIITF